MSDKKRLVRIWTEVDVDEIEKHLILIEDLYGTCGNCKKLGLNYLKDKVCPSCGVTFKYAATNVKNSSEIIKILNRIQSSGLSLKLIERDDYNKAQAKDALGALFKK
jgi:hypothetical protein